MLALVKKYLGWRNWAVFLYNSVLENLFVLFVIALYKNRFDLNFVLEALLFLVFSIFATTYGYLINDFSDRELDRVHGKANTFASDSTLQAVLVLIVILLVCLVSSQPFWERKYFLTLTGVWFLIATFYSLPPLRLKERGKWSLFFVAIAQRLLPVLILFAVFDFIHGWLPVAIAFYVFLRGIASDLSHQLEDFENDRKTGTRTFVVSSGFRRAQTLFAVVLHVERLTLAVLLTVFGVLFKSGRWEVTFVLWATFALYLFVLIYFYLHPAQWQKNPFDAKQKSVAQFLHHSYPSVVLPLGFNLSVAIVYWPFSIFLILQIFFRKLYSVEIISNSFLFQRINQMLRVRG